MTALALGDRVTTYAGYTQALEDSGAVPSAAANRGTILPDARTWQTDAGFRFLLISKLKLITGAFEIQKPYFNFDTNNVDRQLGTQRERGVELSLSGEVVPNLNVAVGSLLGEVKIIGSNLAAEALERRRSINRTPRGRSMPITSSRGYRSSPLISPFWSLVPHQQVLMVSHRITQQRGSPRVAVPVQIVGCTGNAARAGPEYGQFLHLELRLQSGILAMADARLFRLPDGGVLGVPT
jgi:hypothetical protein